MSAFTVAIDRLLDNEGGYTPGRRDPGGETNFGISRRSYPNLDIKNLTRDQAVAIYKRDFWDKVQGDRMPPGVGFQLLDFAVNSGISTATKALQRAVQVHDDGRLGPVTLAAVDAQDPAETIMNLLAERLLFLTDLSTWHVFGEGWASRIAANLTHGASDIHG